MSRLLLGMSHRAILGQVASQTRRALEDFDNRHDFERLSADLLNALGYSSVEPMAPAGGPDGGTDITFRDGDEHGIAFVTLEKKIRDKFSRDLAGQPAGHGIIALFCNVDVSPATKLDLARNALKKGYRLEVFDVERIRSLLDTSFTPIRRRYLRIEDEISAVVRSRVYKLLKLPDAFAGSFESRSILESLLVENLLARLFELLMEYKENEIAEVPGIGITLHEYMLDHYAFHRQCMSAENMLLQRIGDKAAVSRIVAQWRIQLHYTILRIGSMSQEDVMRKGLFLNYGMQTCPV